MSKRQDRSNLRTDPRQIDFIQGEQWRPIAEFPHYFVSSRGRVCSVDRVVPYEGEIRRGRDILRRGRVLKPGTLPSGHKYVVFYGGYHRQVHRLVLEAFVCPCPPGLEALHEDDNPANNFYHNLRWGTRSNNLHDAIKNGKKPIGEQVYNSKLTEEAVRFVRANLHIGDHNLAKRFGVSAAAVKQVRDGVTWKHVR